MRYAVRSSSSSLFPEPLYSRGNYPRFGFQPSTGHPSPPTSFGNAACRTGTHLSTTCRTRIERPTGRARSSACRCGPGRCGGGCEDGRQPPRRRRCAGIGDRTLSGGSPGRVIGWRHALRPDLRRPRLAMHRCRPTRLCRLAQVPSMAWQVLRSVRPSTSRSATSRPRSTPKEAAAPDAESAGAGIEVIGVIEVIKVIEVVGVRGRRGHRRHRRHRRPGQLRMHR